MFHKSRNRIILSVTGSLVLLLAVTLAALLLANLRETRRRSADMLRAYIETYSLARKRGEPGAFGRRPPDGMAPPGGEREFRLSTFYSVAFAGDGGVLAVDNGMEALYSEDELIALARDAALRASGRAGTLLFQTAQKPGYTLVAFVDNTVSDSGTRALIRQMLILGGAAIVALFFVSVELSRRIIRPLEENDRQQKQFISDASHELKTPVAVIEANAELLAREVGENEWLANIRYENRRMGELVTQLLRLSRSESAETPMEPVELSRVAAGETLAFESLAFELGRTIRSDVEPEVWVQGSAAQLTELVSVLLDNALRYAAGETVELTLRRQGRAAVLQVSNEGAAIPPDRLARLFDRFYRLDEARSGGEGHYGLGLSIARAVAEKHGGGIGVKCEDGRVIFTVTLPAREKPS